MDILQDRGFISLLGIKTAHPELVPEFVDSADLSAIKVAAPTLSSSEFANDIAREYPIGDKPQVWLAAAYFSKSAADLQLGPEMREYVSERIKFAADIYGIRDEVDKIMTVLSSEKSAEVEQHWGWSDNICTKYPLHTADLVKLAMPYFEKNRDMYPFNMRREIAGNIYKRASSLNIDVSEAIRKEAGIGYPDRFAAIDAMNDRVARIKTANPELASKLEAYSGEIKIAGTEDLMQAVDAAVEAVEAVDKAAGFRYTGKGSATMLVERPVDLFYSISPKMAQDDSQRYIKLNRYIFDCEKLAMMLDPEVYDGPLGEQFLRSNIVKVAGFEDMTDSQMLYHALDNLSGQDKAALENHLKTL